MLEDVNTYIELASAQSQDEFLERFPHPFLLLTTFSDDSDTNTWTRIRTNKPPPGEAPPPPFQVAQIVKREGANQFSMITIGRGKGNDICIPAGEISKVHAYLTEEDGAVQLVDAGSTNGTLVRGLRLEPKEDKVKLQSGDDLSLGVIPATYYSARDFYAYVRSLTEVANG